MRCWAARALLGTSLNLSSKGEFVDADFSGKQRRGDAKVAKDVVSDLRGMRSQRNSVALMLGRGYVTKLFHMLLTDCWWNDGLSLL